MKTRELLQFVKEVVDLVPELKQVHEENRRAFGEIITYVIMGKFSDYVIEDLRSHNESEVFLKLVRMLENRISAEDELAVMIRTSFCEAVDSHWADKEFHKLLWTQSSRT